MPFEQATADIAFDQLSRYVAKLGRKPAPKSVHRFRTYSRRVETILGELAAELSRNDKKLLRALAKMRKKAGRVRDLDVQIGALRNLRIPSEPDRKARLMRTMVEERTRREGKLPKLFDGDTVAELRRRLKRAAKKLDIPAQADPVAKALSLFADVRKEPGAVSESKLHEYRIIGKRARYLAEMAGKDAEAQRVGEQLKQMQDAIGDWHDWLKLTERARHLFGGVQESSLVAAMQNLTRAKFRHALDAVARTQAALSPKPAAIEPPRPSPAQAAQATAA